MTNLYISFSLGGQSFKGIMLLIFEKKIERVVETMNGSKANVQFGSQKSNVFELLHIKFFSMEALLIL